MKLKISITDADYQAALWRFAPLKWASVKAEAQRSAAERMAEETMVQINLLLPKLSALAGRERTEEFMKVSNEIDRLFKTHDKLAPIAWPGVKNP